MFQRYQICQINLRAINFIFSCLIWILIDGWFCLTCRCEPKLITFLWYYSCPILSTMYCSRILNWNLQTVSLKGKLYHNQFWKLSDKILTWNKNCCFGDRFSQKQTFNMKNSPVIFEKMFVFLYSFECPYLIIEFFFWILSFDCFCHFLVNVHVKDARHAINFETLTRLTKKFPQNGGGKKWAWHLYLIPPHLFRA